MPKKIHPLVSLAVIVMLSLLISVVLFGVLSSTGIFRSSYVEFGGAAAGFFFALCLLNRWYVNMEGRIKRIEDLEKQIRDIQVPIIVPPPGFTRYIDLEHSVVLCYPTEWKRLPLTVRLESVFSEDPLALHPSDEFPGRFCFTISTPGQQTYSLKEVALICKEHGISIEEMEKKFGVEFTEQNEFLQVPLVKFLELLGVKGQTRRDQIYSINYELLEMFADEVIHRDIELVDGKDSLVVEWKRERKNDEPLVLFTVITYTEETDRIFTWHFTDNIRDRDKIDHVRKKILSTVKFWKPTLQESKSKN